MKVGGVGDIVVYPVYLAIHTAIDYFNFNILLRCVAKQSCPFYFDISGDVQARFDTCEFVASHASGIPTGVNKKVI